jgi:sterol desaturase/sphingolipid hydroxylase (fatty acid hydroxylase superfamily)
VKLLPYFALLLLAELAFAAFTGKARFSWRDSAASLSMGIGNVIAGLALAGFVAAAYFAASRIAIFHIPFTWWGLALCFLAEDLAYYWFHRTAHLRRWFWASHVVHHSSEHYNLTTALRQTWTGNLSLSFAFWLPLMVVGFPPAMVVMFSTYSLAYQYWVHTEAIGRLGPLEFVFNTPSHHRVHHAVNPRYLDSNYAGVLIVWDRLFGTFVAETAEDKPRYGIAHPLGSHNPLRIAFHEWGAIARDVLSARSWRDCVRYVFGPPGWSPDGARRTSRSIKAAWIVETNEAPPASRSAEAASGQGAPAM